MRLSPATWRRADISGSVCACSRPREIDRGVRHAARILDAFIDSELDRAGLDEDNLALVGFSQGTMMALHVGLRRAHACAGIVGFSGRLADAKALKGEICAKPPVLLVHGESDELIPTAALFDAVSELGTAGLEVEWHVSAGLGHGIDETGLHLSCDFLSRVLRETLDLSRPDCESPQKHTITGAA